MDAEVVLEVPTAIELAATAHDLAREPQLVGFHTPIEQLVHAVPRWRSVGKSR